MSLRLCLFAFGTLALAACASAPAERSFGDLVLPSAETAKEMARIALSCPISPVGRARSGARRTVKGRTS
ncbi:MAG: hypothetical protein V2I43_24110 [Parvularcula sp.]|jgi:hypothetical protein|nr:hypothetical protein [Parvularcula sp.]